MFTINLKKRGNKIRFLTLCNHSPSKKTKKTVLSSIFYVSDMAARILVLNVKSTGFFFLQFVGCTLMGR